jgi:hypothetical protein
LTGAARIAPPPIGIWRCAARRKQNDRVVLNRRRPDMIMQLVIGFLSGVVIGVAVFSNSKPYLRGVVTGLIADTVIGAIMIDGVDGYLHWAAYLPTQMAKFAGFWIGLIAGVLSGARIWPSLLP